MGQYRSKGALFFDLDGTVFKHGTGEPINDAAQTIRSLAKEGYKIYFTTYRGKENFPDDSKYGEDTTVDQLAALNIPYEQIIWNVPSPRVIVNDDGVGHIRCTTNEGFNSKELRDMLEKL